MVLVDNQLKKLITEQNLIENYKIENIQPASYDISISDKILVFNEEDNPIELDDKNKIESLYKEVSISKGYILKPGECILVILNEKINLPINLCAHIRPRTSLSRLGINTHFQHINPGYSGTLNMQLHNISPNSYVIKKGLRIGQFVFEQLSTDINGEGYQCKYSNENGLRGSRIYEDFKDGKRE